MKRLALCSWILLVVVVGVTTTAAAQAPVTRAEHEAAEVEVAEVDPHQVVAQEGIGFTLTPSHDRTGLAWEVDPSGHGPGGLMIRDADLDAPVRWDLTGLDRSGYRSDLVRVEVLDVDGPGTLTVSVPSAHGRDVVLLDRVGADQQVDGSTMVVQVGRHTSQRWSIDRPGAHVIELRATIPREGGGTAAETAVLHVQVGGVEEPPTAGTPADAPTGDLATRSSSTLLGALDTRRAGQTSERIVIDDGHVDMGPRIVDGHWRVQLKDDTVTPPVWRDLSDVVLHAGDATRIAVPDRPAYAFLGPAGTPFHVLPQVQRAGVVWPGWNTQDPSVVEAVPGSVTWRLRSVSGPGRFALFVTDSFGDTEVYFDTDRPLPQDLAIPRNSHVHGNWAFSSTGTYRLEVEMRATLDDGATATDTRVLTVVIGDDEDPTTVPPDDDGGPGQPVVTGLGDGGDDQIAITTDLDDGRSDDPAGPGPGGSSDDPAAGSRSGHGGPLPRTGADLLRLAGLAIALLVTGRLLLTTRRRAAGAAPPS